MSESAVPGRDRRAESFQRIGDEYHRLRPSYPEPAVDWMLGRDLGLPVRRVLDLGAGTGKLTDSLVARGLQVVAVDPSGQMLDVLRRRHPQVECHVAPAEDLPLPRGSVDAVVVGQAWHWVDPVATGRQLARVLRPGGVLAMAWNVEQLDQPWLQRFDQVQRVTRGVELDHTEARDPHPGSGFGPFQERVFHWERHTTGDQLVALYQTHSAWLVADPVTRERREAAWREVLRDSGNQGEVVLAYRTEVMRTLLAPHPGMRPCPRHPNG